MRIAPPAATLLICLLISEPTTAASWDHGVVFKDFSEAQGYTTHNPRLLGDVNGDKKADIVGFRDDGVYLALATGSGFSTPKKVLAAFTADTGGWNVTNHPRMLADVNGDRRADIVGFANAGIYVSFSTGSGFGKPTLVLKGFGYDSGWRTDRHPRLMADVNGDNRADMIGFANAGTYLAISNGTSFNQAVKISDSFDFDSGWRVNRHPRFMADVNGDGRDDLVGFANAGVYLATNDGKGNFGKAVQVLNAYGYNAGGWRVEKHPRFMADVNGDKRADVVGFANGGVYVSLSTGKDFAEPKLMFKGFGYSAGGWRVEKNPRLMADVNGDNRADIIGFGNTTAYVSLSTGNAFAKSVSLGNLMGYNQGWRVGTHPRLVADITGNGMADIVGFGPATTDQIASRESAPLTSSPIASALPATASGITAQQQAQMTAYLKEQNEKIARVLTDQDRKSLAQMAAEIQAAQQIADERDRAAQFIAINARYAGLRSNIMGRATVSKEDVYARLRNIAPNLDLKISDEGMSSLRRVTLTAIQVPAPMPSVELTEFAQRFMDSACVTVSVAAPSLPSAVIHEYIQNTILAGGCRVDTGVGTFLAVPAQVDRVHLEMEVNSVVDLKSMAFSIVSYSQANTDLGIHVRGPDLRHFELDRSVVSIAPVAFFMEAEDYRNEPQTLRTSFVPDPNGGSYEVYLYTGHFTLGVPVLPGSGAVSIARVFTLDKLTARFEH